MTETLRRAPLGASVFSMPVLQDGPPPGGFPSVRYGRRIPSTGPTGAAMFGVSALIIGYGFYKVGKGNAKRSVLQAEKHAARVVLAPVLQAEEDRRYLAARASALEAEAYIMRNVPGWRVGASPYNSGRWTPPALGLRPCAANT